MTYYFSGVKIQRHKKILLVQETHKQAKGLWSLPLGHVEKGESKSGAAARETLEESGFKIKTLKKLKTLKIPAKNFRSSHAFFKGTVVLTIYAGRILSLKKSELKIKWTDKKQIRKIKLREERLKTVL